ncbi:hypothetical protein [Spirosoma foliorum]|uniref:Uncharacterized protein n=1 Tax=Spirosoma foliorum TaxID=2710596 RepID=A0A7G5H541_9BACT|nr:hypothetical protein [Spirosoma foliorum]QMW06233.1 hypothetical protein H3H32_15765 [Spirosoma foliorum]
MEKAADTFETLLEKYIFTVSSVVIDQLDSAQQNQLVHLLMSCNKSHIVSPPVSESENQQVIKRSKETESQSVEDRLRVQWQVAVSLPGRDYVVYQQRQLVIYQTHIDLLLYHISRLSNLLKQATGREATKYGELIRLAHYQTLQDRYIVKVAKLRADQQKVSVQLNLYYESIS